MNVSIDGKPCMLGLPQDATFPEIMAAVGKIESASNIGITRVCLNGDDITGKDWTHLATVASSSINQLDVETGSVPNLAHEMIDSLEDFSGRLVTELARTAESFRMGDQEKALDQYKRTLDGVQLLSHTSDMVVRNLGINVDEITFGGKPSTHHFKKLAPVLDDMFSAHKRDDMVLLADLIEYELIPQFEDHQKILKLWREAYAARG